MDARVADNSFDAKVRRGVSPFLRGREDSSWFRLVGSSLGSCCLKQEGEGDRALVSIFVLTTSLYLPARRSRRLGGASQSGSEVHQRQILPT